MGVARSPQVRQQLQSPVSSVQCMTLLFSSSPTSLLLIMTDTTSAADKEFDTLDLRNRTVTETLSPLEDLGQEKKVEENVATNGTAEDGEKYDKLVLRNRTVTETLSKVEDFGQNGTEENGKEKEDETEEKEKEEDGEKHDKLVLRNRTVEETLSLVETLGRIRRMK